MLTPIPRDMKLVIMGNNQVAIDAVCCRIIGLDPLSVEHIRLAYEDGFGPVEPERIRLEGDVTLEEAKDRAKGFQVGLVKIDKYFEGTNIQAYAGKPPADADDDYCWGGCPGVMEEVIEVLRLYDEQCDAKLPKLHLVFGKYEGELDIKYGEKVVFVGDCCEWKGQIEGELVAVENLYRSRETIDPHDVRHKDIYVRMAKMTSKLRELKQRPWMRLEGCPVSIGELVLMLAELGGIKNPYFDSRQIIGFNRAYLAWRAMTVAQRIGGVPYQIAGPTEQGAARPVLVQPRVPHEVGGGAGE
jgi:hypothetical protein